MEQLEGSRYKLIKLDSDATPSASTESLPDDPSSTEPEEIVGCIDNTGCRVLYAHTDVHREFMHIILRSSGPDYAGSSGDKPKKPMITCDTYDGPFQTKWSLHFYPEGHPSNYSIHPDVEWYPAQYVPDEQKFASLYVRLKDGPFEMIEARMMTSVLSGDSDIDAALATNMERFMLCPRMKVDEFHREAAGHGWPKLCLTNALRNFTGGFVCVVSLQVLQPTSGGSPVTGVRRPPIPVHRYTDHGEKNQPFIIKMRGNMSHCDAVLQAADWQYVHAHRWILATKSGLFRRLLSEDHGVPFVHKTERTKEELEVLLDIVYLEKLPKRGADLSMKLLEMVKFYEIPLMVQFLERETGIVTDVSSAESLDLKPSTSEM